MEDRRNTTPDRLLAAIASRNAATFFFCRFAASRERFSQVVAAPQAKLLHFPFSAIGDMVGGSSVPRLRNRRTGVRR